MLRLVRSEQVILSLLAGLIGVAAAYGSIRFRELIALIQGAGFASMGGPLVAAAAQLPWWQIVLVPTLGGLAVGLLVRFFSSRRAAARRCRCRRGERLQRRADRAQAGCGGGARRHHLDRLRRFGRARGAGGAYRRQPRLMARPAP
jgi:membrane protein implicated in regulation of membrane protease activity